MGIFDGLIGLMNPQPNPRDVTPNVANKVKEHLAAKWPELVGITGLWFTGSQVHSIVRGVEPPATSDTDIFVLKDAPNHVEYSFFGSSSEPPLQAMMRKLGLSPEAARPRQPPADKPHYTPDGMDVTHPRGEFDIWTSSGTTVRGVLSGYPRSHSHCRMAFSFTEGLVVLPNEEAR